LGNTGLRASRLDSFGVGSFDNEDPLTDDGGSQSRSPQFPKGRDVASDAGRVKKLLRENSGLREQVEGLQKENDELREDLRDNVHDAAGMKKTLKGKDGQIAELRRTNQAYGKDISGLQGDNGKLEDANYDLGQKFKGLQGDNGKLEDANYDLGQKFKG
jgi:predicted RNase H-like nuclease (RuvC/YqgF family)